MNSYAVLKKHVHKYYQKLNASSNIFMLWDEMSMNDGRFLTAGREVIERWEQHFDEHQNVEETTEEQENGGNDFMVDKGDQL